MVRKSKEDDYTQEKKQNEIMTEEDNEMTKR